MWWILAFGACDGITDTGPGGPTGRQPEDTAEPAAVAQDVLTTHLRLDLTTLAGHATVVLLPATEARVVKLAANGLYVSRVKVNGEEVEPTWKEGIGNIPVENTGEPVTVDIDYTFSERSILQFDGWMPSQQVSFIWPDNCMNLYPCNPSPDDGVTVTMEVTGQAAGLTAVYPSTTTSDGPSYMPGIAVGDYTRLELGHTTAGTALVAWHFPGEASASRAADGTANLVGAYDFFESTYGAYAFGPEAGTVEVNWGSDSYGGMEHHPYVHVGTFDFSDEEAQIHEAAHAWFGDGVRLECWEDFVLSEGTTTYIAARAAEEAGGLDFWPYYVDGFLKPACDGLDVNTIVLPDETCNEIDFENDDLWSLATYMKGACFYEEVGDVMGVAELDAAIADFYRANVTGSARMGEMIDTILAHAPEADHAAIETLATEWLRTYACPENYAERCRSRQP